MEGMKSDSTEEAQRSGAGAAIIREEGWGEERELLKREGRRCARMERGDVGALKLYVCYKGMYN